VIRIFGLATGLAAGFLGVFLTLLAAMDGKIGAEILRTSFRVGRLPARLFAVDFDKTLTAVRRRRFLEFLDSEFGAIFRTRSMACYSRKLT